MAISEPSSQRLCAGIFSVDGGDCLHKVALEKALQQHLGEEAEHHGAPFDKNAFKTVLGCIENQVAHAYVILVEIMGSRDLAGSTVEFPSVITEWNPRGKSFAYYPAVYGEDIVISGGISEDFRKFSGNQGLGTYFVREKYLESIRNRKGVFPATMPPYGMILEYGKNNDCIKGLLSKFGAQFDPEQNNAVLRFPDSVCPRNTKNCVTAMVTALGEKRGLAIVAQPHIFAVTTLDKQNQTRLSATFTRTISTFSGNPIIRVQMTSSQNLDDTNKNWVRKSILSILDAAKREVETRDWYPWTPRITSKADFLQRLMIHAKDEPLIVNTLREMGAVTRKLGTHDMMPMVINFKDMPDRMIPEKPTSVPYTIVRNDYRYSTQHGSFFRDNGLKPVMCANL
ncbi:MAG: hypothetical protein AB7S81_05065 [Bdellovibrionales bacterium]